MWKMMKLFHISDLHIGKRINGFSMLEDQQYILDQIVRMAQEHRPDGLLIAGDLYDKSMPSAEAVELADEFLYRFAKEGIPVWLISGNHDCAERIAYGGRMMEQAGIFVSGAFQGKMQKYTLQDEVDLYLLPYVRPAQVRRFFPEETIATTQDAVQTILNHTELRTDRVNILVMHQFLAGALVCDSEEISVGGSDQVSAYVADKFDYVALGHLHGAQKVGRETVRYCGSPLKYSFSEAGHHKSVTVVSIEEGAVRVDLLPLVPRLDLRKIRGPIAQLLRPEVYEAANRLDYLHVTLTDEREILDAIGQLREVYPNIMKLDFERSAEQIEETAEIQLQEQDPMELFAEFFQQQNGIAMTEKMKAAAAQIWEKGGACE